MILSFLPTVNASAKVDMSILNYITEDGNLTDSGFEVLRNMSTSNGYTNVSSKIAVIEQKIYERSELISQINANPDLSANEKKHLENGINKISKELEKLGVSDTVPDKIKKSLSEQLSSRDMGVMAESPVSYFDFYENIFQISSYEASYTYNGKSYRFCSINLEDKPYSKGYLSRIYRPDILVKGSLYDINALNQYLAGGIAYAAKKANQAIPYPVPYVKNIINSILSFIPDTQKPMYLLHGSNVHLIPTIVVNEYVRYIYVYNPNNDEWILSGGGNYANTITTNEIFYNPGGGIIHQSRDNVAYFYGTYNLLYQDAVAWYDLQKDLGMYYEPLDGVLKTIDIDYEENYSSQRLITLNLCGDKYPGNIVLY